MKKNTANEEDSNQVRSEDYSDQVTYNKNFNKLQQAFLSQLGKNNKNDFTNEVNQNPESKNDLSEKVIDDANKYFLLKILSPEITKNEDKRRLHKDQLMKIVKNFLIFQFCILAILIIGIIVMIFVFHGLQNDIKIEYLKIIINFVSVYITSVVVEIIAMLKYIVSNVFDTSITGLVQLYKDTNKKDDCDQDDE